MIFGNNILTIDKLPLVTVVITTYNHAVYLPEAIESVLNQTWQRTELIVVDDGSTDNTRDVAAHYSQARYIYQENKGLPSARNTGALNSTGKYIVFLDADDILYPGAIEANLNFFELYPECGFISGGHDLITEDKKIINSPEWQHFPQSDHYLALLRNDYISMHGTVMYRRVIFDHYQYDETLTSCEDYDFYLQIAKNYPVFSHNIKLAAYRKYEKSMSANVLRMYKNAINVLNKHLHDQSNPEIKASCRSGKKDIRTHYAGLVLYDLTSGKDQQKYHLSYLFSVIPLLSLKDILFLNRFYLKHIFKKFSRLIHAIARRIKRIFKGGSPDMIPRTGKVWIKDLNRTSPFSKVFGYDRGGPVDRYYIETFLKQNANCIKGNVLEIGDNAYTRSFGKDQVTTSDVLYVDDSNPHATIIGDLSKADHIPSEKFDCIILTQTLHLIYDFNAALAHCYRILKKGGALLLTVPGISPIDYGEWSETWYWSFTGNAVLKLLGEHFDPVNVQVNTFGNVLSAAAFLYGMGNTELSEEEFQQNDPHYQVIIAAKVIKN